MKDKKKSIILISCGGTGGHILPGLSLGCELLKHGHEVIYLVNDKPVAKNFFKNISSEKIVFPEIFFGKLISLNVFSEIYKILKTIILTLRLSIYYKIKLVCSCGSGSSFIPLVIFKLLGIRSVLLEQNVIMGKANRILMKIVEKGYLNFPCFNYKSNKLKVFGNPVVQSKRMIEDEFKEEALLKLGLKENKRTLLFIGGSQGAKSINELSKKIILKLIDRKIDFQVIHLSGEYTFKETKKFYETIDIPVFLKAFSNKMDVLYSISDFVVSRAGAGVLSELAFYKLPSILIPLPFAKENHQFENAKFFKNQGFCEMFEECELNQNIDVIVDMILNPGIFYKGEDVKHDWNNTESATLIREDIESILNS